MHIEQAITTRIEMLQKRIEQQKIIANDWLNNSTHAMYQADKEIKYLQKQIAALQNDLAQSQPPLTQSVSIKE